MKRKILHLLQWRLEDITTHLPLIKEQGFTAIQTSPLQGCRDGWEWWKLYQPTNYRIGNSQIGNKEDLKRLCDKAKEVGIEVYVDVALRNVGTSETDPNKPNENVDKEILPYIKDVPPCSNYDDRYEATMKRVGLPMVDYTNRDVQEMHRRYLGELLECGVDGFRIDMLKHFALPEEGCDYIPNVYGHFDTAYLYGEVLFSPTWLLDKYANYTDVLTDCRLSDESKSVLFVESHDSFLSI